MRDPGRRRGSGTESGADARGGSRNPVARRINRERLVVLGWGRAILLQIAHPLVAQGVADHTRLGGGPASYFHRAWRTIGAMLSLTFGSAGEARATADRIDALHAQVTGTLPHDAGIHRAGTAYSAQDPALLRWVHATLLDSLPLTYEHFVGPLTAEEKDRYCEEAADAAVLLGLPRGDAPASMDDLRRYMDGMQASGAIVVTDTARILARTLLYPPLGPAAPLFGIARLVTAGLLPAAFRDAYGLPWSNRRERTFRGLAAAARRAGPFVPALLRDWPAARTSAAEGRRFEPGGEPAG